MKAFRILGKNIGESFKSVIRNFSLSLASISCIFITLVLVGFSIILSYNVNNFTANIEKDLTIVVFLERKIDEVEIETLKTRLKTMDNVLDVKFYSKEEVKKLSIETFKALNLGGVARIDFLIDNKSKKVYVNEPNTIPGSLSFYMFKPMGKEYTTLLDEMITTAIKNFKSESKKVSSFESNILSTFNGSKGVKGKI